MTALLTPRELECIHWLGEGKDDGETASILSLSPRTVRFHLDNAKTKLGAKSRPHLVKLAALAAEAEREANRLRNAEEVA